MANIPNKIAERITAGIKRFQPVLTSAKSRDVNESDTVIILTDMLGEVFGYDKYAEITSEHAIRGTFCDLAISFAGNVQMLLEAKAIGLDLKDSFVKQAVDYAANKGIDWVVLTNAIIWRVYKVTFAKPIDQELILEFDFTQLNGKSDDDVWKLFMLCKEGWQKQHLVDFHEQKQALSRFFIGAMVLTDSVVDVIRRELRRVSPDVKVQSDQIREVLLHEVLKREVVEGEKAEEAKRRIQRAAARALRAKIPTARAATAAETAIPAPEQPLPAAIPPQTLSSTQPTPNELQ